MANEDIEDIEEIKRNVEMKKFKSEGWPWCAGSKLGRCLNILGE